MSEEHTCRRYLPEKAGLHAQVHRHCIIAVEDHLVDVVELTVSEVLIDKRASSSSPRDTVSSLMSIAMCSSR